MSSTVDPHKLSLGSLQSCVDDRMDRWREEDVERRIWNKDHSVWSTRPIPELTDRLGWLDLHETMLTRVPEFEALGDVVRRAGVSHVVLLGMGGSSLAPEVYAATFGRTSGCPELIVLDSTHPAAIVDLEQRIELKRTVFVVSSKSGTTVETLSLLGRFWSSVSEVSTAPGNHFVAITDPGTPLQHLGEERQFRTVVNSPPDVGGRYSALTPFGLVPAALMGGDVRGLLSAAGVMVAAPDSPGLQLGAVLGELAEADLNKVTFVTSPALSAFPDWIEQLIAESTGKTGKGILPVVNEPPRGALDYQRDRLFVFISLDGDQPGTGPDRMALSKGGHPVVDIQLHEPTDLGQEVFRWEMAVACAGAILGINPFDQPDVQLAKDLARQAMQRQTRQPAPGADPISASDTDALRRALSEWPEVEPGDYISLQAYLAQNQDTSAALNEIRATLGSRLGVATTCGYGPRFLHSTGQLHKGGPNTGHFLQLVDRPEGDVSVPGTDYTFGELIAAQALGDYRALVQRQRSVLRVDLGNRPVEGLENIIAALT
jgi:transaldolase/glucose-6-phosphate isomerase